MVPLFTGHLSASHGLLPAFKALRSMPTAARGVLVVITEQGEAEMAVSEQGLIIGALIRQKNEQGIFALKKILDWKNGKYAFFEGDEYPNEHIKKTLRMDIANIIRGAEDPSAVNGGTTGSNPRVDISSVHNKALQPADIAAVQSSAASTGFAQPQVGAQSIQGQQVAGQQGVAPQQISSSQGQANFAQQQGYSQQQGHMPQQLQQPQQLQHPQQGSQLPQGYSQDPAQSNLSATQMPVQQAPNTVQASAAAPAGGKSGKKPRKFASTNFAMDVFGGEAPVTPAPKVGETVEDDLLRNLSDLNRLGPAASSARPAPNSTPAAQMSGGYSGIGAQSNPNYAGNQGNPMAGQMPPALSAQSMNSAAPPPVPSQLGRVPASTGGAVSPAGMMAPPGMAQNAAGMNQQSAAAANSLAGAPTANASSYQHQQSVSDLQRQAMADEAALMQAISSTTNPVFVPGGSGPQSSMVNEALYSEQQIRAAQSVSGGYSQTVGYGQTQSNTGGLPSQPVPSQQISQSNQAYQNSQPPSQLTPQVPSQLQQPAASTRPPAPFSPTLEGKAKINPTKTLLESDLFFVDDELTGEQYEPPSPPMQPSYQAEIDSYNVASASGNVETSAMSTGGYPGGSGAHDINSIPLDQSNSGGYAPSSMTSRGQALSQTPELSNGYSDSQSPSLGANFSQTPSFGPGSTGAGASTKNPGSAILESMKKRNLGGRSSEESMQGYTPSESDSAAFRNSIPAQNSNASAGSANALSQYNQNSGFGSSSTTDLSNLNHAGGYDSQMSAPLGAQIPSQLGSRNALNSGAPLAIPGTVPEATSGVLNARARIAQSGATEQQLDEYGESRSGSDIGSSSTFPARGTQPESYDDIPNPQVGIATSSRIARSVTSPGEISIKGKRDEESASQVARSRIRSGVSQERSGLATFIESNKTLVFVGGGLLLVFILVGLIIGVLFALHIIKV